MSSFWMVMQTIVPHIFWIGITITVFIAIWHTYRDMADLESPYDVFDKLFPRPPPSVANYSVPILNGSAILNVTISQHVSDGQNTTRTGSPEDMDTPFIHRFIALWGYIGASIYTLKVTTIKIYNNEFENRFIPWHIANLFVGTIAAIIISFILFTGGFFGLTIDVGKIADIRLLPYVYAAVAFFSGYNVRHIIALTSGIIKNVFLHDARDQGSEKGSDSRPKNPTPGTM
jgi:hypothetical protein